MADQEDQPPIDQGQFRRLLEAHFSDVDIKTLCFDMEIDDSDLPGGTRKDKILGLIKFAERNGRMRELLDRVTNERPHVNWSTAIKGRRRALILWFNRYTDKQLNTLTVSEADGWSLKRVLSNPEIGQFNQVTYLPNPSRETVIKAVNKLFSRAFSPDVLLLYIVGHGLVDESGELYLAAKDTNIERVAETAVSAQFIAGAMDRCPSLQKILVLDCTYASLTTDAAMSEEKLLGIDAAFKGDGQGRIILAVEDRGQYIGHEQRFEGAAAPTPFTALLVNGLSTGEADLDQNGIITVDELYGYLIKHDQPVDKWLYGQDTSPIIAWKNSIPPPPSPPPPRPNLRWASLVVVVMSLVVIIILGLYFSKGRLAPVSQPVTGTNDSSNVADEIPTAPVVLIDTTPLLPPASNQLSTSELEEVAITPESVVLSCGESHPPIASSNTMAGSATIVSPVVTGDCFEVTQDHLLLEISWQNAAPGVELWLFVYSPLAKLYYPHHCDTIRNATGGQNCQAIVGRPEPYDIIVIFADAAAHTDLQAVARRGGGIRQEDLPADIKEKAFISVIRTE